jgi:hypothetical protein
MVHIKIRNVTFPYHVINPIFAGLAGIDGLPGLNGLSGEKGEPGLKGESGRSITGPEGPPGFSGRDVILYYLITLSNYLGNIEWFI